MLNSKLLSDLDTEFQEVVLTFFQECSEAGIKLQTVRTYSDFEYQDKLYTQGRTAPGDVVTKAKGGQSLHNWRLAIDVVPIVDGKAVWKDMALWDKIGAIGTKLGMVWGGTFGDKPHFQKKGTGSKTWRALLLKYPKGLPPEVRDVK